MPKPSKVLPKPSKVPAIKRTGGGAYDPEDKFVYFMASNPGTLVQAIGYTTHMLVAVNELEGPAEEEKFIRIIESGTTTFLDSGVFNLAGQYAAKKGISHDEGLRTPLTEIDGFEELLATYTRLVKTYEDRLWGYVELDIGGRDQKRETRAKLEAQGMRPIPVYHPLNDGWDYFDELASQYDRICVGNIVQASAYVRLRIMRTIWERKQAYPHLWVHLLGMTPNQWAHVYPSESMDSSSWLVGIRWFASWAEKTCGKRFSNMDRGYVYRLGDLGSHMQQCALLASQFYMNARNWRHYTNLLQEQQ